ncbi:MAG: mechanosensitive ion channel [Nitrospira sp. LK70]|nr:mechanosensitive ion channel [Nitrospira sp. LK70]
MHGSRSDPISLFGAAAVDSHHENRGVAFYRDDRPSDARRAHRPSACRRGHRVALQGVLSNLMAGLSIIFSKPYKVGEHVVLLGVHGEVVVIDIFTTRLMHVDHSRVIIPN